MMRVPTIDGAPRRALQRIKHAVLIAAKRLTPVGRAMADRTADAYARIQTAHTTYQFDPSRYRRSFIVRELRPQGPPGDMPAQVFCFWTGDNEMSGTRRRNLEFLHGTVGLPVRLVTPRSLQQWLRPEWPLHPGYEFLSLVHKADYLRAYFLHHHGGAYCDIKRPTQQWRAVLEEVSDDEDVWYVAAGHDSSKHVARMAGPLGRDLRVWHHRIPANGAALCRANTPLTLEWLTEVERRLDYYLPQLAEFPGGERGAVVGYPISWNRLLNQVHHPLTLKFNQHVRIDNRIRVDTTDYA